MAMSFYISTSGSQESVIQHLEQHAAQGAGALYDDVKSFIHDLVSSHDFPHGLSVSASGHDHPAMPTLSISVNPVTAQPASSAAPAPDTAVG